MSIKSILEEAIGEDKPTVSRYSTSDIQQVSSTDIELFKNAGHNKCLADLRNKIPEISQKIIEEIEKMKDKWVSVNENPPLNKPVLVAMKWFSKPDDIVYAVLKYVEEDDHDWVTADDESEISHALYPVAWKRIEPIDNIIKNLTS
jgi:hypothetical protein